MRPRRTRVAWRPPVAGLCAAQNTFTPRSGCRYDLRRRWPRRQRLIHRDALIGRPIMGAVVRPTLLALASRRLPAPGGSATTIGLPECAGRYGGREPRIEIVIAAGARTDRDGDGFFDRNRDRPFVFGGGWLGIPRDVAGLRCCSPGGRVFGFACISPQRTSSTQLRDRVSVWVSHGGGRQRRRRSHPRPNRSLPAAGRLPV